MSQREITYLRADLTSAREVLVEMDKIVANLRAELAEAQGSAKLNGLMCDLGFASLDTWRDETLRLRAALADANASAKSWERIAEDQLVELSRTPPRGKWQRVEHERANRSGDGDDD
jgi:hypothetical protein